VLERAAQKGKVNDFLRISQGQRRVMSMNVTSPPVQLRCPNPLGILSGALRGILPRVTDRRGVEGSVLSEAEGTPKCLRQECRVKAFSRDTSIEVPPVSRALALRPEEASVTCWLVG
jgi:hypothetical protein